MGPWSRSFIAAVAGNAERPEHEVENLSIEPGVITATVEGREVRIAAPVIPARIWDAVSRFARGMGVLEDAIDGKVQSVHLEHLLEADWEEDLIPVTSLRRPGDDALARAAVAFAVADEIERTPRVLLRWRGAGGRTDTAGAADPWRGRPLEAAPSRRKMVSRSVLARLGDDGVVSGHLGPAYDAVAPSAGVSSRRI